MASQIFKNKIDRKTLVYLQLFFAFLLLVTLVVFSIFTMVLHIPPNPIIIVVVGLFCVFVLSMFSSTRECVDVPSVLISLGYSRTNPDSLFERAYEKVKTGTKITLEVSPVSLMDNVSPALHISIPNQTRTKFNFRNTQFSLNTTDIKSKIGPVAQSLLTKSRFSLDVDDNITLIYHWLTPVFWTCQDYDSFESLVSMSEDTIFAIQKHLQEQEKKK